MRKRERVIVNSVLGKYLVTAGSDGQMKVWDVRTFKAVHEYWNPQPAKTLSISQKGLLAIGWGSQIQVYLFFGGNF